LNTETFSRRGFARRGFSDRHRLFGALDALPRLGVGPFALGAITSSTTATATATALSGLARFGCIFQIRRYEQRIIGRAGFMEMIGLRLQNNARRNSRLDSTLNGGRRIHRSDIDWTAFRIGTSAAGW
jgi:hypothetical protein